MQKRLTAIIAVALALTACQKEPSFEDPAGNRSSSLLARMVETDGTDSTAISYRYNAARRLIQYDVVQSTGESITYKMVRNATGVLTQTVVSGPELMQLGIDSIPTNYFYTSNGRVSHSRYDVDLAGVPFSDSTVYSYDAGGNISASIIFASIFGTAYEPIQKFEYAYAGGNLTVVRLFSYDDQAARWESEGTITYGYDTKVNPLKLGYEALLISDYPSFGNNNVISMEAKANDPADNVSQTLTLRYNSANKPTGGTRVENPGSVQTTLRYDYR